MSIDVRFEGGMRFEMEARGHTCTLDLAESSGGGDTGPTPPEVFVGAVGACIGVYLVDYCDRAGLPTEGLAMAMSFDTADNPKRIGRIQIEVKLPPGIPEDRLRALRKVADSCLIHQTLARGPEVAIAISRPESA
jgi:putative redox protein